jgi:membrane protease subunit HflC
MKNKIILGICAILAVIGLSQSIVITYSDEYTLIKQFKKVESVVSEPGLSFKTPFIQSTQKIPKKKMIYDIDPSDTTTKDKKIMSIDSFVIWSVEDPTKYLSTLNASEKKAKVRISNTVYNSMKTIISSMTQNEIIENRDGKLAKAITGNISNLDAYGIKIYAVETKKLDLADSNKESVYKRMISDRQNIAAQYTADGEYQSSLIKNETDKTVKETIAKAEAEAEKIKAEGEAQYMQILSDAYNDENKADFYNYVRSLDALKTSLVKEKTLVLDKDNELVKILSGN